MKHFYSFKFLMCLTFILVVHTYSTAQNNIQDVTIMGQAFKKITGTISVDETLDNSSLWIIADTVRVAPSTTLTITEGTQIYAETLETVLLVDPLGQVDWQGTSTEPIVFDALANAPGQGAGDDSAGQWFGVAIEGNGDGSNSGTVRYVRIMYAGYKNADGDGEIALKLENVGNLTTVEYVQVYKNAETSVRINGGDVNLKYMIATNGADTAYRFDDDDKGWTGAGQFWIVNKDIASGGAIDSRDGSDPILSNITISGIGKNDPNADPASDGIRVRDDGRARVYNTVVTGVERAVRMDSPDDVTNGDSFFRNSAAFDNLLDGGTGFHSTTRVFNPTSGDYDSSNNNSVMSFPIVDSYVGTSTTNSTAAGALDAFFTDVNYVGAVESGNDWTAGWCLNLDGTLRDSNLSTNRFDRLEISVYPNPVVDELKINSKDEISNVVIYNTLGKKVYESSSVTNNENGINMSQFKSGMYFVRFSSGNVTETIKVIKR